MSRTRAALACTIGLLLLLCTGSLAQAHVSVRPRQSTAGAEQRYTVRVPTEGDVATASVHLEVPEGVRVSSVEPIDGTTITLQRQGERIIGITWARAIPPKAAAEFILIAPTIRHRRVNSRGVRTSIWPTGP